MKLSDQFHVPHVLPQVKADTSHQTTPVSPGVIHSPAAEQESDKPARDYGYPQASTEELARGARGVGGRGRVDTHGKDGKGGKGSKGDVSDAGGNDVGSKGGEASKVWQSGKGREGKPYTRTPQRVPGGPTSPGNAAHNVGRINGLQQRGLFPELAPGVATVARNAILGATVNGLVSLGFTAAEHGVSNAMDQRIKAQSQMSGAEKKNADGTKTTVDPSATEQQKIDARVEGAEIKIELLANSIISINEGPAAPAVGKSPNAPTTTSERLGNLEKILDAAEGPLEDIAKRYGQLYTRPAAADAPAPSTPGSRLERIEQRYVEMNKMLKRLIAVKEAEAVEVE